MTNLRVYRRQWYISRTEIDRRLSDLCSFVTTEISKGIYLHHDQDLRIERRAAGTDRSIVVVGLMVNQDLELNNKYDNFGRYVIIDFPWLSLDATGAMGVYYSVYDANIICGSSNKLLSIITGKPLAGRALRGQKMNWDPVPICRVDGFKKLFIDQELDIRTGSVRTVPRTRRYRARGPTVEHILREELRQSAGHLKKLDRPLFLAMTAGCDSRTVFAALVEGSVPFEAFTMVLSAPFSKVDARIASQICKAYGIKHSLIYPGPPDERAKELYLQHSGGYGGERGVEYAVGDYYRSVPHHAVVIHGGCFEVGHQYYGALFKNVDFGSEAAAVRDIAAVMNVRTEPEIEALKSWFRHRIGHPIEGLDLTTDFYLDQRRGGWGADNRQEEDIFPFDWLIFANKWSILDALLAAPVEQRPTKLAQRRAMDSLLPGLSTGWPLNPRPTVAELTWSLLSSREMRMRLKYRVSQLIRGMG